MRIRSRGWSVLLRGMALLSAVALCSCGGGSGGSTPAPTPDFTIAVTPPASLIAGGSASATVTVPRSNGHTSALTLSLSIPPAGLTGSGTVAASAASGPLTLNAGTTATLATQTLTVSATDGTTTRTASFAVPVVGAATSWSGDYSWTCSSGQNCQSVFDLNVPAGAVLSLRVNNVSSGSVAQIALYAPGVALGGTNLLTGTTKELRCANGQGCSNPVYAAGEQKNGVTAASGGVYHSP